MKVLIVGLGGIGQRHVRNLRTLYGEKVQIIAHRVRRLKRTVSPSLEIEADVDVEQKYNIKVFDELECALDLNPDFAIISNPSSLHLSTAIKVAKKGCHLFIEKPLSNNLDSVDELINICEKNSIVCFIAYQLRFHPGIIKIQEILTKKILGKILAVNAEVGEHMPSWHSYEDYREMYAARKELGGGVILSQIHEFDYLYSWFGLPQKIFSFGGKLSSLEIDVEDTAKILMSCIYNGYELPVSLHMDFIQKPPSRSCKIIAERGKLVLDLISNHMTVTREDGTSEEYDYSHFERNELFLAELKHFINCVNKNSEPLISLTDGINSLRMALAAKTSLLTGKVEKI
jgi:predicted dehydrogenase